MLIVPIAHERQSVQRLPWVTFGIIAINVLVFLFTNFSGSSESEQNDALMNFEQYYWSHPYLTIPEETKQFFSARDLEQISLLKEGTDLTQIPEDVLASEQAELDGLAKKALNLVNEHPFQKYGYIPGKSSIFNLITCMFVHSGWLHLIGNMLFLYLAGCSIEDLWGRPLYIGFYLTSGIAATLVHVLKFSDSVEPLVGASGAIAGLMGAFLFRLYKTKIRFFYILIIFLRPKWGTFEAPAYVMLPLWLVQQVFFAAISDESAGVAFWAHIGGFLFGFIVAFAMKMARIEEKFIAPAIEKRVSLAQNPDFLRAMELSEKGDYPDALILLEKVVRKEPNHIDAYMEMRRIAEIKRDSSLYSKYSASVFEILYRNRDWDLLQDLYSQYQSDRRDEILPAKTFFSLASFFEETQDFAAAEKHYIDLIQNYPDDAFAMKGASKLSRLYFDKLQDREKGIAEFWRSYHHPLSSDQWRSALQTDMKRYDIPDSRGKAPVLPIVPRTTPPKPVETPVFENAVPFVSAAAQMSFAPEQQPVQSTPPAAPARHSVPVSEGDAIVLPSWEFDGQSGGNWTLVRCRMERIQMKGLLLRNHEKAVGQLGWKKIQKVSVGRIRKKDPADSRNDKDYLLVDLVTADPENGRVIAYRLDSSEVPFEKIFPGVEQTFAEAFQNFIGIIINNSSAQCYPNRDSCTGPLFATFPDEERYETRARNKLLALL